MTLISTDTFNSRGRDCVCTNRDTDWKAWTQGHMWSFTKPSPPRFDTARLSVAYGVDNLHFARPRGKFTGTPLLAGVAGRAWIMHLWDHADPMFLRATLPHREFMVNVRWLGTRGTYRITIAFRDHTPHCTKFFREVWGIGTDEDSSIRLHTPPKLDTIDRVDYTRPPRG